MRRPGLINDGWVAYANRILFPAGAGRLQRQECRRAFYAGAIHLFHGLTSGVSDGLGEPTADDMALMDRLKAEIDRYAEDLRAGRA